MDKIINGDSIIEMEKMEKEIFDFCFADPPYFLQLDKNKKLLRVGGTQFDGCDDEWDRFSSMDEYKDFTKKWLSGVKRVLKPNGLIAVIGSMQSIYEIGSIMKDLGFWIINDVIWLKSNPTPNFSGSRLNNSHETIIIATKNKNAKFTFNYKTGKELNNGKQMGSVWTFPVCSGSERLKDEDGNKLHSTQKPEALLHRLITIFTKINDTVFDPFGGTMTSATVAKKTGRHYVTVEKEKKYFEYGVKRLKNIEPFITDIEEALFDKKEIKATMEEMIKSDFFRIGEKFFSSNNQQVATLANLKGHLLYNNVLESMHEVAGKMNNKNVRLNGFDHLYVEREGSKVLINEIRKKFRIWKLEANHL